MGDIDDETGDGQGTDAAIAQAISVLTFVDRVEKDVEVSGTSTTVFGEFARLLAV